MPSYDNKVLTGDQLVYFSGLVKTALASKADSSALTGKQDTLVFNTAYNATTNPVATMADIPNSTPINFEDGYWVENTDDDVMELDIGIIAGAVKSTLFFDEGVRATEIIAYEEIDSDTGDILNTTYLDEALDDKQDTLVFNTAYNASSNKVATMADITTALGSISSFSFEIVQSLPQNNISTSKIYLVAKQTSGTNQVYTEYAYVNNAWEIIGDTSMTIDTLSNQEVATIWSTATATT